MVVRHRGAVPSIAVEVEVAVDGVGSASDVPADAAVAVLHLEVSVHGRIADDVVARAERVCGSCGVLGLQIAVDRDPEDPSAGRVVELEVAPYRDVDEVAPGPVGNREVATDDRSVDLLVRADRGLVAPSMLSSTREVRSGRWDRASASPTSTCRPPASRIHFWAFCDQ